MRLARPLAIALTVLALAACGANAPGWTYAPAPSATPLPSVEPSGSAGASVAPSDGASNPPSQGPSGPVVQISALNIQFNTTELSAPANTAFQIEFQNDDNGIPHNVEIKDSAGSTVFNGAIFNGVDKQDYAVPALAAGTYKFLCSVHTAMTGTLTVQ
jgi:plastocyanin